MALVDRLIESEAIGDLLVCRISKNHLTTANHHGHIGAGDVKSVQQILNVRIPVEIDVRVRMAVSRQELFDAERSGAMIRANQHDISDAVCDQFHSAKNERSHDQLTELVVGLHERQQPFAIDLDDFARLPGAHAQQRGTTREHIDLACELSRSIDDHKRLAGTGRPNNLNLSCPDDEKWHNVLTWFDKHLARLD